ISNARPPPSSCAIRGETGMAAERTQSDRTKPKTTPVVPAGRAAREPGPMNTGHAIWRNRVACGYGSPLSRGRQWRELRERTEANMSQLALFFQVGFVLPGTKPICENKANLAACPGRSAARSEAKWCAADPGPRLLPRTEEKTGVPDQRCTT